MIEVTADGVKDLLANDATLESPENRTDRKIAEIETEMSFFETQVAPLLQTADPARRVAITNPFHFLNANKGNTLKNFETASRVALTQGMPVESILLALNDPRHYGYRLIPDSALRGTGIMIGTIPIQRSVGISEKYDFKNTLNRLTMVHELVHLAHQALQRKKNMMEFLRFHASGRKHVIIDEEYDAYVVEIETLDLLLGGELREGKARPEDILKRFSLPEDHRTPITMLCMMAERYFPVGRVDAPYPKAYTTFVDRAVAHDGYELRRYGQPGVPRP